MREIGFHNFRKFEDFPLMELNPITIFVGENNAGKSTVVKGILALSDFFNRGLTYVSDIERLIYPNKELSEKEEQQIIKAILKNQKFSFNTSYLAHIGTFQRAIYNQAKNDEIHFFTRLGSSYLNLIVKGDAKDEEAVSGCLTLVQVMDQAKRLSMSFDLEKDEAILKIDLTKTDWDYSKFKEEDREEIQSFISSQKQPLAIKISISEYFSIFRFDLISSLIESVETAVNASIIERADESEEGKNTRYRRMGQDFKPIKNLDSETKDFLKKYCRWFSPRGYRKEMPFFFPWRFQPRMVNIEYLYAHAVTQTIIYSAKDSNDYLSKTIHDFASEKLSNTRNEFIIKWMKVFGIGIDFNIRSVGGEAHLVTITNKDGRIVNLADKGMGSIQLMVLLFRLAIYLPSQEGRGHRFSDTRIVIIEEPEQNLHPMLQSKLADLLYTLNKEYGFRFIIETHSEYLIRRSQVIVSENFNTDETLKENPFKVYYFPSDGVPYDMEYLPNGMFANNFGEGFTNEAGKLHMTLLKNQKKQNKDV